MAQCSTRSLKTGRNGQPLLRSETLVGANRRVGEKKRSPFAVPDHRLQRRKDLPVRQITGGAEENKSI